MLICTTSQIESRIFDILQTILQIDECDLRLISHRADTSGTFVEFQCYDESRIEWVTCRRTITTNEMLIVLSFL